MSVTIYKSGLENIDGKMQVVHGATILVQSGAAKKTTWIYLKKGSVYNCMNIRYFQCCNHSCEVCAATRRSYTKEMS